jgi:hypothetical protein
MSSMSGMGQSRLLTGPASAGTVLTVTVRQRDAVDGHVIAEEEVPLPELLDMLRAAETNAIAAGYALPLDTGSTRPPTPSPDGR